MHSLPQLRIFHLQMLYFAYGSNTAMGFVSRMNPGRQTGSDDMENRIQLSFQWTEEELGRAVLQQYTFGYRRYQGLIFLFSLIASFIFFFVVALIEIESTSNMLFNFSLLFIVAWSAIQLSPTFQAKKLRRHQKHLIGMNIAWIISEEGLSFEDTIGNKSHFQWSAFVKIVKTSGGFLFFQTPALYQWLPLYAFQSREDIDRLIEMSRRKTEKYIEFSTSPNPNIIAGFIIAPLIVPFISVLFTVFWLGYPLALAGLLFIQGYMLTGPLSYIFSLLLGLPFFLFLRKSRRLELKTILAGGAAIGMVPPLLFFGWSFYRGAVNSQSFIPFTYWLSVLALSGMAAAALFWFIVVKMNVVDQSH